MIKFKSRSTKKISTSKGLASCKVKRSLTKRGNYGGSKEDWKALRTKVLIRDNYTCRKCGKHKSNLDCNLNVHHIKRISRGGTDSLSNLMTLCERCHAKQPGHEHLRRKQ